MALEGILGRLHALLGLQPNETELILNVVNHDLLTITAGIIVTLLSGGVSTLKLDVLVLPLEVLAAVALVEDTVNLLDLEVVGENLVSRDDILYEQKNVRQ